MTPADLASALAAEWRDDIRPFWLRHAPDPVHGGFRGFVGHDLSIDPAAEKGVILNARILWTFARASAIHADAEAREVADRACDYLLAQFVDPAYGGVYWTVDHVGRPRDTVKKLYAQAFAIYAFAEHFRVTGRAESLDEARRLFTLVERHGHDAVGGGYGENYDRDWQLSDDQRLSAVDLDARRSMNTHLHVLEAYTALQHASPAPDVADALTATFDLFLERILNPATAHLHMFFDDAWQPQSDVISFGHDIEASWLLCEAADVLGDPARRGAAREAALRMADAVLRDGIDEDGGLRCEADRGGIIDDSRDWWPQAEAVVGFLNAWQISGDRRFFDQASATWRFIDRVMRDRVHGEWHWKVSRTGVPDVTRPKIDRWKCPYHNGRMCFEGVARLTTTRG